jgi:hypothetical protein
MHQGDVQKLAVKVSDEQRLQFGVMLDLSLAHFPTRTRLPPHGDFGIKYPWQSI